jgi:penicillin-binding protein 1A
MDAWFAGYHPHLVAVVWIGYDQPRKLGDRETGGGLALPVWIDYMATALRKTPVTEMSAPEGVLNIGGEWFYEEYTRSQGVRGVGMESQEDGEDTPSTPSNAEKSDILDLFGKPSQQ